MEIPRVMLGSRFGFWLMPWIVEMATSARWIPYCSLCVQQPFQNLKIIEHIGFLILWDELYHCFLTPLCSGSEAGHLSGVLQLCILILTKCTWIVKSFTHFFILPLHFFFLVNIVLGYTSLIADLFLVLWFMIYESCRWKVMHSPWSVSDLWFIRLDGTLVDNKQRKSLLCSRLKSHQQFSSHNLKL